jgi:HAD superfamily hydrolase (TIGR01509 family)
MRNVEMSSDSDRIPFDQIDVVLLDAGGTLVSLDFEWVERELAARGVECRARDLERAEAAARPAVSREAGARLAQGREPLGFEDFLSIWLRRLAPFADSPAEVRSLAASLAPILRPAGESWRLWSVPMPGVKDALADLCDMGLRLAVVSNSDGSAERSLSGAGLRPHLEQVIDSAVVRLEKPDPAIFTHALAVMGCRPERTLHVGDMYFADVVGARGAGLPAVLLDPYDDWVDVDCMRLPTVSSVRDLLRSARTSNGR